MLKVPPLIKFMVRYWIRGNSRGGEPTGPTDSILMILVVVSWASRLRFVTEMPGRLPTGKLSTVAALSRPNGARLRFSSGAVGLPIALVTANRPPATVIVECEPMPGTIEKARTLPLVMMRVPDVLGPPEPPAALPRLIFPDTARVATTPIMLFEPTLTVPIPDLALATV